MLCMFVSKREEYEAGLADLEHQRCTSVLEGLRGLLGEDRFGRLQQEDAETHLADRERGRQTLSWLRFFGLNEGFRQLTTRDVC